MSDWDEFEWDKHNEDKILDKHGVRRFEAEEAVGDPNAVPFPAHSGNVGLIGRTGDGRTLIVILTRKERRLIRVVTARDANSNEKGSYRRRNR